MSSTRKRRGRPSSDTRGVASKRRTICEVLREIGDEHPGARPKVIEAVKMAKRMSAKLLEYNKETFKDWWKENPDWEEDVRRRIEDPWYLEAWK